MQTDYFQLLCDIGELNSIFTDSPTIEDFFNKTVSMVAKHMHSDVCSIYLYNELSKELVLEATVGLNKEFIKKIRLKYGEGIAGQSIKELRTICESEGSKNPFFKSFPGTNEEEYESYLAVPILRGVKKIGVLMLQRKKKNYFIEKDIVALKAITSQLASAIENARVILDLSEKNKQTDNDDEINTVRLIKGDSASEGIVYSEIQILDEKHSLLRSENLKFNKAYSVNDFNEAIKLTEKQLEHSQQWVEEKLADAASLIFNAHLLIIKDKNFSGEMLELINNGMNPPEAIIKIAKKYIDIFGKCSEQILKEKAQDIEDLSNRLLNNLLNNSKEDSHAIIYDNKIVIARELFPSDIFKMASSNIKGIILVSGGVTSHLAVISSSLQIPLIIADNVKLLKLNDDTKILMDADIGNIYINPEQHIIDQFKDSMDVAENINSIKQEINDKTFTKDKVNIKLMANINLLSDLSLANDLKAEGIGLYRSEFPFIIRNNFPSEIEQYVVYKKLFDSMPDKVITFRTLDIGGDKTLSYYDEFKEQNPFLGMRSIRFTLNNPDIFNAQIKAVLRAGYNADLRIMFPMVSSINEFRWAKELVTQCITELENNEEEFNNSPEIGMMVEIPAVVDIIDEFAKEVDFFSIGTNDLIQYMLAVDRTNEKVSYLYVSHHPSVLRAIEKIVKAARKNNKDISICGNMANEERYIEFLIGIGIRSLSLDPRYFYRIQKKIETISIKHAEKKAKEILKLSRIEDIEKILI